MGGDVGPGGGAFFHGLTVARRESSEGKTPLRRLDPTRGVADRQISTSTHTQANTSAKRRLSSTPASHRESKSCEEHRVEPDASTAGGRPRCHAIGAAQPTYLGFRLRDANLGVMEWTRQRIVCGHATAEGITVNQGGRDGLETMPPACGGVTRTIRCPGH